MCIIRPELSQLTKNKNLVIQARCESTVLFSYQEKGGDSVNKEKKTAGQIVVNVKAEGITECLDALDDLAEAVERANQLLDERHQKSNITITGEVVR